MNWDTYLKEVLERAEKGTGVLYFLVKNDLPRIAKYCLELREAFKTIAHQGMPLGYPPMEECQWMIKRARDILEKEISE